MRFPLRHVFSLSSFVSFVLAAPFFSEISQRENRRAASLRWCVVTNENWLKRDGSSCILRVSEVRIGSLINELIRAGSD